MTAKKSESMCNFSGHNFTVGVRLLWRKNKIFTDPGHVHFSDISLLKNFKRSAFFQFESELVNKNSNIQFKSSMNKYIQIMHIAFCYRPKLKIVRSPASLVF